MSKMATNLSFHQLLIHFSKQKGAFYRFLKELKVPDGFSSNISHCVNSKECKISGLKSHDCHIILQYLLPIVILGLLVKDVVEPLIELAMFFNMLCSKSLKGEDVEQIKKQIPLTLSKLEMYLPSSCFDVMLHLPIHLADKAFNCWSFSISMGVFWRN